MAASRQRRLSFYSAVADATPSRPALSIPALKRRAKLIRRYAAIYAHASG